jgi:hypothetical protein
MSHEIYRVVRFEITGPYRLWIEFDDDLEHEVDFEPILKGPLFGPLKDLQLFNQVSLNDEMGTLVWPTGADFAPETLHNWPSLISGLRQMVARWEKTEAKV